MAQTKFSQLPAATVLNDTDIVALSQGATSRRMAVLELRERLSGIQSTWDVTGASAPASPVDLSGVTVAQTIGTNYDATFIASGSGFKFASTEPTSALPSGQAWAKFTTMAYDVGDNLGGYGFVFTNAEATEADLLASFGSIPVLVGTVSFIFYCAVDHSSGTSLSLLVHANTIVGALPNPGLIPVGTTVFLGVDYDTDEFVRDINGTVDTLASPFPIGACKVWLIADATPTPVIAAQPLAMSFSATDGGRTGFAVIGDAIPPASAEDAKRYLVQNTGTYGGKNLNPGDVAEFYASTSQVIVTPAIPVTEDVVSELVSDYLVANPPLSLFQEAVALARCWGVFDDPPIGYDPDLQRGDAMVVGPFPAGDFTTFSPYSVAVWDGAAWANYQAVAFAGVRMFVIEQNWPLARTIMFCGTGDPTDRFQPAGIASLLGDEHAPFSGGPTFADLLAAGWLVEYPKIAGLTVNTNNYPPPQINNGDNLYVGGTESAWFIFSGDMVLNIGSRAAISNGTSQELPCAMLVVDLVNAGVSRAAISFNTGSGQIPRFLCDPSETRRFLIVRKSGGAGGTSVVPLDNVSSYYNVAPGGQWQHYGLGFDNINAERSGDVVRIGGAGVASIGAASAFASLVQTELFPIYTHIFSSPFWDGSQWLTATVEIDTSGNITILSPASFPVNSRLHISTTYNRRGSVP
jgi:hypothetical protein